MKRTHIYGILAAAALVVAVLLVSCVRELDIPRVQTGDHASICLTPVAVGPVTKADEPPTEDGNENYNENTISNYYWFIYSDQDGSNVVLSGFKNSGNPEEITLDNYFPSGGTGYVYVVANLPVKPEGTGDAEWFEYVAKTETAPAGIKHVVRSGSNETSHTYSGTLATLKTLEFGKNTPVVNNSIVAGKSEFYNYTSATTGLPAPEKFVMRTTAPVPFTLQERTNVTVTAKLKRVAAKVILDLLVAQEVKQTSTNAAGQEQYKKTWIADVEHIQIYMLWGSTHGNLAGTPVTYSTEHQDWFYFASPRYAMYKSPDGGEYNAATDIVEGAVVVPDDALTEHTVSSSVWEVVYQIRQDEQNEPIWLWKSTVAEDDRIDDNIGNLSYGDWDYLLWLWNSGIAEADKKTENIGNLSFGSWDPSGEKVPALDANGNIQRRLTTRTENRPYYAISSLPLYTMPISWNVNDAHAPFIKIILPWQGCIRANDGEGDITEYDKKNGARKTTEFYYKIFVPKRTTLDANGCYHISLDLSVLGSEADEVPVLVNGEYHVVGWNEAVKMGGDQSAGRYLNCATSFEFYSQNEMNIPVHSSHDIEIVGTPTATYQNYSGTTVTTSSLTHSTSSTSGDNFKVTTVGNNKVTIVHEFNTDLESIQPRDVSPITYTVTIQHKGDGGSAYRKTITVIQYPSLYVKQDPSNHYVFVNSYNGASGYQNIVISAFDNSGTTFRWQDVTSEYYLTEARLAAFLGNVVSASANLGEGNANTNNYNIYVSALNELPESLSGAYIADPREDTGTTLTNINNLTNYRRTRQDASMAIAPAYKIASSYGMCANFNNSYGGIYYDNAVKRCATYQENGYPAGRWRVPTKAEILFAVSLSNSGCIPPLFDGQYRANDGQYYDSTISSFTGSASDRSVVRCVYDVWYWGENKYDNQGNEITGTGTAATQWIGFKTE